MIDVIFLLIAFFMILISFISAELIELELPKAEQATVPEDPGERQYISVQEDGETYFGADPIDVDALPQAIEAAHADRPSLRVYLRADEGTPHRHVNHVMRACAEAGIFDLIIAANQE